MMTRFRQTGFSLLIDKPLRIPFPVLELQGILAPQVSEPFFERFLVQKLADSFPCGDIEVVIALGADPLTFIHTFAIDRRLASLAENPESFRHAPFLATDRHPRVGTGFNARTGF
jgi:hypothetical protein